MNKRTGYIVFTAVLLALCVLFQMIRVFFPLLSGVVIFGPFSLSVLIIGALVNMTLVVASWTVGLWSGVAIGVLASLISFSQGFQTNPVMMIVIALGNALIAVAVWPFRKTPVSQVCGVVLGALLKFGLQYALTLWVVAPFFVENEKAAEVLTVMFSWPQIITGLLGGFLAFMICGRLPVRDRGRREGS